ncbi:MAG: [LysW]-aminoadipate/[LysW]-glutamate kinase [Candidatus Bathyarchaeota archaeon]|nr:[LysW]-aminoadipate/[LysW]-glutamate kinase [Candidatus Bathyarchaeota archaeon]MDP7207083.1 [LysW]-aminoadipate/[LysW]-glutamate kinase [Candidatus Bathyarchaeota archaeon]
MNELIVIKIGGDLISKGLPEALVDNIVSITKENKIILVHGGGDVVTRISTELGHPPKFIVSPKGFRSRYTNREEAGIFTMVMAGKINKEIVSALQGRGVQAVGLSGLDGALVRATRKKKIVAVDERGRRMLIEGGYTGKIDGVNKVFLGLLVDNGYIPVISSLAMSKAGKPLNVDGDRMASSLATAMGAENLVLLTDVANILVAGKSVDALSIYEAKTVIEGIGPGMITKLYAAIEALEGGVGEVVISSGFIKNPIELALEHKAGTVIKK